MLRFLKNKLISLSNFLSTPPGVCWLDKSIFEQVNAYKGRRVLNLGAGAGTFDDLIEVEMLNLDITPNPRIHVVADAHKLPFKDGVFDCLFSNAVLEHVRFPWKVTEESCRVLKKEGKICVNVPFLNIIHDKHDYFRFTLDGLRSCLNDFQEIKSGVSAGPMAFLVVYLGAFFSTIFSIKVIGFFLALFFKILIYPLFYLDLLMKNSEKWQKFADAFYYIGVKR